MEPFVSWTIKKQDKTSLVSPFTQKGGFGHTDTDGLLPRWDTGVTNQIHAICNNLPNLSQYSWKMWLHITRLSSVTACCSVTRPFVFMWGMQKREKELSTVVIAPLSSPWLQDKVCVEAKDKPTAVLITSTVSEEGRNVSPWKWGREECKSLEVRKGGM